MIEATLGSCQAWPFSLRVPAGNLSHGHTSNQMTKRQVRPLPAPLPPRRLSCECVRHGRKLAPKFTDEPLARLQCYCSFERTLSICCCTTTPWGNSLVSVYTGQQVLTHPAEMDNPAVERMYEVGRLLHCVVRDEANRTNPAWPKGCSLSDYEEAVFQTGMQDPKDLGIDFEELISYFRARTRHKHGDVVNKYHPRKDEKARDSKNRRMPHNPGGIQDSPAPINVDQGFVQAMLEMPAMACRPTWKAVFFLLTSGKADSTNEAYAIIAYHGWPNRPSGTLRSDMARGNKYLREVGISDSRRLESQAALRALAERDGWQVLLPLIYTPKEWDEIVANFNGQDGDNATKEPN